MELWEEGVVLRTVPYQDHHHIVTLFSHKKGLMRLFVRGYVRKRTHALVTPLTKISFTYRDKGEGLAQLREGKVLDHHLALRENFDALEAGCQLAKVLIATQMVGKPAPDLYRLFLTYLSEVSRGQSGTLVSSFLLKVLKHEGLLQLHTHCSQCGEDLTDAYLIGSDAYCSAHAPLGSLSLKEEERVTLLQLVALRSLKEIRSLEVPPSLKRRVEQLFEGLHE